MVIKQHIIDWKFTYLAIILLLILATCGRHLAYASQPNVIPTSADLLLLDSLERRVAVLEQRNKADRIVICDDLDPTKRPCNEPVIPYFRGDADAFVEWWVAEHGLEHSDMKAALAAAAELGYKVGWRDRSKLLDNPSRK